ncbi:hypothetical protein IFM89_028030 [Coptis chinensis]|uniref:RNase H type-1 domain-containing protein n=1 Tax=Coptis chinensis TaxID=261450 RepID=A0A835HKF1_9MAGN|nr:hypothetical protein IFM89_028030 [Coptis chinensis]
MPCRWDLPNANMTKVNIDGAAKNNPGETGVGAGAVGRNSNSEFVFVYSRNIGIATNYMAECTAILEGMEVAVIKGRASIWVESDSRAAVTAFNSGKIPWQLKQRWRELHTKLTLCTITSTWREVNFTANKAANFGVELGTEILRMWWETPMGL